MTIVKILLLPFSIVYGVAVSFRNILFNTGILKSKEFNIPVICIGNITVGGTGKTPHTELIISELRKNHKVACLSRGYKRKTSGFILGKPDSTANDIGDEPRQILEKFPDILVACDAKRTRGIEKLLALPAPPEVIVLDDAFQHRYVKAGKNIVLMDYSQPVYKDHLLPAGRLRETRNALKRADYIIVTKCPDKLTPIEKRIIFKHLKIKPYQQLFFTSMQYGHIKALNPEISVPVLNHKSSLVCVTGIAQPQPFIQHLTQTTENITDIRFPDHHWFTTKDIREIQRIFQAIRNPDKYIFTTEKDAVRLKACSLPEDLKNHIFYIPIEPVFINKKDLLIQELHKYVTKNKRKC